MRFVSLVLVLASSALPAGADAPRPAKPPARVQVDRVVAVVDDVVILASELELRLVAARANAMQIADPAERERRLAKLARELLDSMIDDALVLQAGIAARVTVEDKEVDATIDYLKKQHQLDDQALAEAMKQQGVTRETLKHDVLRQRAVNQLVGPKVTVTEEDIRVAYDQLQRRSAQVSAVFLSQIQLALPEHPTEQQLNEARQKAADLVARVKAGEDFAALARQHSDDATTRANGGVLGWFEPTTIRAEWEDTVFGMDKGEVRGPLPGERGLYVLYAGDAKRTTLEPYAKLRDQLESQLRGKALARHTQAWLAELRKRAYIDIKL